MPNSAEGRLCCRSEDYDVSLISPRNYFLVRAWHCLPRPKHCTLAVSAAFTFARCSMADAF